MLFLVSFWSRLRSLKTQQAETLFITRSSVKMAWETQHRLSHIFWILPGVIAVASLQVECHLQGALSPPLILTILLHRYRKGHPLTVQSYLNLSYKPLRCFVQTRNHALECLCNL